jgi:hypothetical protein
MSEKHGRYDRRPPQPPSRSSEPTLSFDVMVRTVHPQRHP